MMQMVWTLRPTNIKIMAIQIGRPIQNVTFHAAIISLFHSDNEQIFMGLELSRLHYVESLEILMTSCRYTNMQ